MAEKMRVHILAKELNVPSKMIIEKCNAEGIDSVKNHMSTLSAGLHATIREWFSEGAHTTTVETTDRVDLSKMRPKKTRISAHSKSSTTETSTAIAVAEAPTKLDTATPDTIVDDAISDTTVIPLQDSTTVAQDSPDVSDQLDSTSLDSTAEVKTKPTAKKTAKKTINKKTATKTTREKNPKSDSKLSSKDATEDGPVSPAGPQNVPAAAKLRGPRVVRYEAPDYSAPPARSKPSRDSKTTTDLPVQPTTGPAPSKSKDEKDSSKRKGRFTTRRSAGRLAEVGEKLAEWRDRDLAERKERLAGATGRKIHRRQSVPGSGEAGVAERPTKATVHEPIRIKEFCSTTGVNFMYLFKILKNDHNILANINMNLDTEVAQLIALNNGVELEVIPAKTELDKIEDDFAQHERKNLQHRPPIVTILGHVDHGKTSLLDAIRKTQVAASEDGGITQHISSYHIETKHGAVTFLDTPGHEAFTSMRARGAQLTDVVVLVIAADDGIMPQTIEAIHHAQAAEVPIVVALNKIDLGDQNKLKIYGQLAEHNLTPSGDWGGDTDVIETSATTGKGISELIDHLSDLSSILELKSDPTLPAQGTVIEAETKLGVGPVVQLLVKEGTLRVGNVALCGNAYGKIRALLDDRGRRIAEAGPSIPVEVWGLDDIPSSGDKLFVVENLQLAKTVASETKQLRIEASRMRSRKVKSLEDMFLQRRSEEVPELNAIIKADVDGSISALQKSLSDIPSDEVRLSIRHAAVGMVNDSDVLLAATSNGIIIAYRVEIPTGVRRLAEQHGVEVRPYRVIYDVVDDVRKALSGLLAPEIKIEQRGKAEVRKVFRVSKAGMVAGSYVTEGIIDRNHLAKVLRGGVLIRENCKFASLKHFKDDAKEVKQGLECGIRLEGFDDIKVGDMIETYETIKIARSL